MNKVKIIFFAVFSFSIGMILAFLIAIDFQTCPYLKTVNRAMNYTDKECYTKDDIELIVFGDIKYYDR